MSSLALERAAGEVLGRYPDPLRRGRRSPLGNYGGFSGARLWRIECGAGMFCLRAWPPENPSPERLATIHRLMQTARAAGLAFVPALSRTRDGSTWVELAGRLWEVTSWMSGRADYHARPSAARLEAAVTALARLHQAWVPDERTPRRECPAVRRRLRLAFEWAALTASGWNPVQSAAADDPVRPWAERAWQVLRGRVGRVPAQLLDWCERSLDVQPCLCDNWHDHVLFDGDTVSGLIDFGSIKTDHVAVDLARLLGSLVGDDAARWEAGLTAYARCRPLQAQEMALARLLDRTGTVLGAANWLMWLYRDGKQFEDRAAVARRLEELVRRLEGWAQ